MSAPHTSRTHASRVLLVADDPLAGKILAAQFTVQGHEVHWARDTMEARWLWLPKFYDVVVIDLQKDPAGGMGFVQRIKAESPDQKISFVSEVGRQNLSGKTLARPSIVKTGSMSTILGMLKR
jgi:DNA-binding response OmpR family regulator